MIDDIKSRCESHHKSKDPTYYTFWLRRGYQNIQGYSKRIEHFQKFIPQYLMDIWWGHVKDLVFVAPLPRTLKEIQEVEAPRFLDKWQMKVVRLSALRTGRFYPTGNIPGTHFWYRLSRAQGHSSTGRIISKQNSNDTIGNRTRDLAACSAVPQPTSPPSRNILSTVVFT
jgi:hypothetical protein